MAQVPTKHLGYSRVRGRSEISPLSSILHQPLVAGYFGGQFLLVLNCPTLGYIGVQIGMAEAKRGVRARIYDVPTTVPATPELEYIAFARTPPNLTLSYLSINVVQCLSIQDVECVQGVDIGED